MVGSTFILVVLLGFLCLIGVSTLVIVLYLQMRGRD